MYGAALYWRLATARGVSAELDPDMIRGKDVLEVACMRGGGARFLAEVGAPRSYVATDNVREHVERCAAHPEVPGLRFEFADAGQLAETYPAESFDAIFCVQAIAAFDDIPGFVKGAAGVLRPGGRLVLCDAINRMTFKTILDAIEDAGLEASSSDLSRAVHAVGICTLPVGRSYMHIVAEKASAGR